MAILIDPPRWPAHGTVWSHLVSDTTLAPLHRFAVAAGIPARAFERDHYDVPAERYEDLIALGAEPVSGRDLVRRLRASGLRRTPISRERELAELQDRWATLVPAALAPTGERLLKAWGERGRLHHGLAHLREVLDAVDLLTEDTGADEDTRTRALLAAWFHDAVHISGRRRDDPEPSGGDEEASARLADQLLNPHLQREVSHDVARLVRMTAHHRVAQGDVAGAMLSDADLSVLGAEPGRYADYAAAIRAEYAYVPEADFRTGRAAILAALLDGSIYATSAGRERWEARARQNVSGELAVLTTHRESPETPGTAT